MKEHRTVGRMAARPIRHDRPPKSRNRYRVPPYAGWRGRHSATPDNPAIALEGDA